MAKASRSIKRDQDPPAMTEAFEALEQLGYRPHRPSPYQLKIGEFNFWPNTGKITIDPDRKCSERGLEAFLDLIRQHRPPTLRIL